MAYNTVACCRCCCTVTVALMAFIGVVVWAPNQEMIVLELSKPCNGVDGAVSPRNSLVDHCQVFLVKPQISVEATLTDGGSVSVDVGGVSVGQQVNSIDVFGGDAAQAPEASPNECQANSTNINSGSGVTETFALKENCPLVNDVLTFDKVISMKIYQGTRRCRSTKCLKDNNLMESWEQDPSGAEDCKRECPLGDNGGNYEDTVVVRSSSGELYTGLADDCEASTWWKNSDYTGPAGGPWALGNLEKATFNRLGWGSSWTSYFALAIFEWLVLRCFIMLLAYDAHVGIDYEKNPLFKAFPALGSFFQGFKHLIDGWLGKTKMIWLTAPTNALLTPLTTLRLHEDCASMMLFDLSGGGWDIYKLCAGVWSWSILLGAVILVSGIIRNEKAQACFKPTVAVLFAMGLIGLVIGGALLKYVDYEMSGFSLSIFLGIDAKLAFSFSWPSVQLSLTLAMMRVILFFMYLYDVVEDIESSIHQYRKVRKQAVKHVGSQMAEI